MATRREISFYIRRGATINPRSRKKNIIKANENDITQKKKKTEKEKQKERDWGKREREKEVNSIVTKMHKALRRLSRQRSS